MITHHLQKHIISELVEQQSMHYAEIKPSHIEGNVFTYHLQNLIKQKLIAKNTDGTYSLTSAGKLYGINSSLKNSEALSQAHSIILLSIRENNKWLLRKRLVQPLYGKIGFMHGEPLADERILDAGARILQYRTGMSGEMAFKGSGYVCLYENGQLVAYSHFSLLEVSNLNGTLIASDKHGENFWLEDPDFAASDMIPSMQDIALELQKTGLFFLDKSYEISES